MVQIIMSTIEDKKEYKIPMLQIIPIVDCIVTSGDGALEQDAALFWTIPKYNWDE